ncbi:MAG: aldo/keto reductase [Caldilineaceae bacterium]|nr:aldo/keto reductase [Caldilineaceae bacterium]
MKYRPLGRTGMNVAEVSFGAWAIGGSWGEVDDEQSMAALHKAVDEGVNFIDTADVYGDGRSERLIAQLKRERPTDQIFVATKAGRRLNPHVAAGYTYENLRGFVERSLQNLDTDSLDLLQLHCPPSEVYDQPEVFAALDRLVQEGKVRNYGVSVETVDEAVRAVEYPNVKTVQIIFNIFRQKPAAAFFRTAVGKQIGVLARVPLASGLLTGKITPATTFAADDHRNFNRHGEAFDVGETFSGVPLNAAFDALEGLKPLVAPGATMAQFALRWILMFDAVTCAIPGAKRPDQVADNCAASELGPIERSEMEVIRVLYDTYVRPHVHHKW